MTEIETVGDGRVVFINFSLRNDAGEVLDESKPGEPLFYLHGYQNIVPGLESQLAGKAVGDRLTAVVPPEQGYGVRLEGEPQRVRRTEFPKEFEIFEGRQLVVQDAEGNHVPLYISEVKGAWVSIERNHPLAGQTLHFDVEITRIRQAVPEELAHGHPHGPEGTLGHHH